MKTEPFDIADQLQTDADIYEFLSESVALGGEEEFIHALGIAARAKGMSEVAELAGVTRASLYKSLSKGGNPNFRTISKIVKALGFNLTISAA